MKRRLLAVFDAEETYMYHLVEYLNCEMSNIFDVKGFTNIEELLNFCNKSQIDILLVSSDEVNYLENQSQIKKIIVLYQDTYNVCNNYSGVNKYQSADNLIRELVNYCNVEETETGYCLNDSHKKTKIIGVYSPVNDPSKNHFSLALSYIYSKICPTLYFNLEEFSGLSKILFKDFDMDLSDLFYFYNQSPNKLSVKLFSAIQSVYDIDFMPTMKYCCDLRNINVSQWRNFIYKVIENTDYEIIILDLSNMINDIIPIFEMCTTIYMPSKNDFLSRARYDEFEEYFLNSEREDVLKKFIKIEVPCNSLIETETNYIDNLLLSPFISCVKDIVRENKGF